MAKKKKKKNIIAKRSAKLKQKKQKKRKLKLIKSKPQPGGDFGSGSNFVDIKAPEGFRTVSISQAMMEYSNPVMERAKSDSIDDANDALNIASDIWNYTITLEKGNIDESSKQNIVRQIETILGMSKDKAAVLFDKMIERKRNLLPEDIQPKASRYMFIRKEVHHLVTEFNYGDLNISETITGPNEKDKEFIDSLLCIDKHILDQDDYGKWEDDYFSMEEKCSDRYEIWLKDKGVGKYRENFPFCIEIFNNFTYRYIHDDQIVLNSMTIDYFEAFFSDHLLRKVMVDPHEFVNWPPAIKLFYRFLFEKEYLDDPEPFIGILDVMEPLFIKTLREKYS